jgi:hypothetical protein
LNDEWDEEDDPEDATLMDQRQQQENIVATELRGNVQNRLLAWYYNL